MEGGREGERIEEGGEEGRREKRRGKRKAVREGGEKYGEEEAYIPLHTLPKLINPLTTEFFPPRQHIFMHSAHTTFIGTPLPQHSLLSGQTWWGPHTWRDPSGNTVNDIHDPPQAQKSEVKCGCQPDFRPAFP